MKKLSKSNFVDYYKCPHRFYLYQHLPESKPKITESDLFSIEEGIRFEEVVRSFFTASDIRTHVVFENEKYFAEADIVRFIDDREIEIYEVKASAMVKNEYMLDISFQRYVASLCGFNVVNVYLLHVNKAYVFNGDSISSDICTAYDIEREVVEFDEDLPGHIEQAFQYLNGIAVPNPSEHKCNEKHKCDFLQHESSIPEYHVGLIPRISKDKFYTLWNAEIKEIAEVPEDFPLSDNQKKIADLVKKQSVTIDMCKLNTWIEALVYPLCFLDYETYAPVIPFVKGFKPFEKMVIQYSLHRIDSPGTEPVHMEHIMTRSNMNIEYLIQQLINDIGRVGSIFVWNASFEKSCNNILSEKYPGYADELKAINNRMVDQRRIFQDYIYADYRFKGSSSIKNVLPVLVPDLSYDRMQISQGDIASYRWKKAVIEQHPDYPEQNTIKNLLDYCHLDTLAMVRIHQVLTDKLEQ